MEENAVIGRIEDDIGARVAPGVDSTVSEAVEAVDSDEAMVVAGDGGTERGEVKESEVTGAGVVRDVADVTEPVEPDRTEDGRAVVADVVAEYGNGMVSESTGAGVVRDVDCDVPDDDVSLNAADVERLVAEAEERGYLRGRNERIDEFMGAPALWQPSHSGGGEMPATHVMILDNLKRSVWED